MNNLLRSIIFSPPPIAEENAIKNNFPKLNSLIPYYIIETESFNESKEENMRDRVYVKILYSHGNKEDCFSLKQRFEEFLNLLPRYYEQYEIQYMLMFYDYPGYGESDENITLQEKILYQRANLIYKKFIGFRHKRKGVKNINLIWGYSIGTAFAIYMTAKGYADGVILQAPFRSILTSQKKSTYFFSSIFVNDMFLNYQLYPTLICEKIVLMSDKDEIFDYKVNKITFKEHLLCKGKSHDWFISREGDLYLIELLFNLIKKILE